MDIVDEVAYRTMGRSRVVVINTFDTLENDEKFKAMLETPDEENRATMEQAGIKFSVTVWIVEKCNCTRPKRRRGSEGRQENCAQDLRSGTASH